MKTFRFSIPLGVLAVAIVATLSGCDFINSDDDGDSVFRDVITYTQYDYTHNSLIAHDVSTGERSVLVDSIGSEVAWTPDGKTIAYTGPYQGYEALHVYVMNVETGDRRVATLCKIEGQLAPCISGTNASPVWSPDAKRIGYVRCMNCEAGGNNYDVFITALDTSSGLEEVRVTDNLFEDGILDWSPNSESILMYSTERPDGTFDEFNLGDIYEIDLPSLNRKRILIDDSTFAKRNARYSPKGDKIAFLGTKGLETESGWNTEIYISDADGSNIQRVTENSLTETSVSWSPSGAKLCFAVRVPSDYPYKSHIYVINTDGSGLERITSRPGVYNWPQWRPKSD